MFRLGIGVVYGNISNNGDVNNANVRNARIFGSVMSILSMSGALLIIVSYIAFKDVRTKARFILLHMSVGDFGVGCVNFLGAVIYFDKYISATCTLENHSYPLSCSAYRGLCKTQAFFASFFTIASILWTLVLAMYVYILVVDTSRKVANMLTRFAYFVCWGLPLCVSIWFVFTNRLGSTRYGSGGWCSLKASDKDGNISVFTVLFGSDLWIMTTFVLILLLYVSTHCFLKLKMREMKQMYNITREQLGQYSGDQKFLLIPLFFIIMRIASVVFSILYVYTHVWHRMPHAWHVFVYYCMAIGDSGQGLVNGFIFCLLTPRVRNKFLLFACCLKRTQADLVPPLKETSEQRKLLEKMDISYNSHHSLSLNQSSVSDDGND